MLIIDNAFLKGKKYFGISLSLTDQHFMFRPVYLLNLLPFVLCILLFTVEYYTKPLSDKIVILQSESFKQQWDYPVVIITMALSSLIYLSWAAVLVRNYNGYVFSGRDSAM